MINKSAQLAGGAVCFGESFRVSRSLLVAGAIFALPWVAAGQIASDQGANYTLGWTNASNGGTGFTPWVINNTQDTGVAGVFIGDPAAAGISGMAADSFGFFANPIGSGANAGVSRGFLAPLAAGQVFSFQWGLNWDSNSPDSNRGFNLFSGATQILNINMANSSTITINGNPMFTEFGTQAFVLSFEQLTPTSLRVFGTGRDGSETYDNTFTGLEGAASGFAFYFNATENGVDERQMYFNNLSIVPEPAVSTLLLVGLAAAGYAVRRRNRAGALS